MNVLVLTNKDHATRGKVSHNLAYSSAVEGTSFGRIITSPRQMLPDAFNILILDDWSGHLILAIGCDPVSVVGKLVHGRKKLSFPVPLAGVR